MEESGGGVTFSGGEPLQQPAFVFDLLERCQNEHIHTAVDTSGQISREILERACALANLILYDLKSLDDTIHHTYTGVSNKRILDNLNIALNGAARVVLRIPFVSGFNDSPEDQQRLIDFVGGLPNLEQVDILPYHRFGTQKYKRFHKKNRQNGFGTPTEVKILSFREELAKAGFAVNIGG
jgi:pyruvate formate lyase activating enzyme